jgi:hypothetical protein
MPVPSVPVTTRPSMAGALMGRSTGLVLVTACAVAWACGPSSTGPSTGTVSGSVTSSLGGGIAGVTVAVTPLGGSALPTVQTTADGTYSVTTVPSGAGTVTIMGLPANCTTPSPTNFTGLTGGGTVTINIAVTCTAPTGTVTGVVTSSLGGGLGGATVIVTPTGMAALPAVATSTSGVYSATHVPIGTGTGSVAVAGLPTNCTPPAPVTYSGLTVGGAVTTNVVVTCGGPTAITRCQAIGVPGRYAVTADISSDVATGTCITINADSVVLECSGHTISFASGGIAILGAYAVTINNCNLSGPGPLYVNGAANVTISNSSINASAPDAIGIVIEAAQNVMLLNCEVTVATQHYYAISVDNTKQAQFNGNRITSNSDAYIQNKSSFVTVTNNIINIVTSTYSVGTGIYMANGSHNTISRNQIDGGYDGNRATQGQEGADDGIVLAYEDGDAVQGNAISNTWDAGIETVAILTNSLIATNTMTNIGDAAIAAYHGTNWVGNTVLDNQISGSPYLVLIFYSDNAAAYTSPPVTAINFENNTFKGNVFQSPILCPPGGNCRPAASLVIDFSGVNEGPASLPLPFVANDNLIADDTLPTSIAGFYLLPASAFIDGGGNVCNPENPGNVVACGANAASVETLVRSNGASLPLPPPLRVPPPPPRRAGPILSRSTHP